MSHVELEVRDDDGAVVAPGEPGELFVRGPNTCVGFFDDPERTAATFDDDGWVRSRATSSRSTTTATSRSSAARRRSSSAAGSTSRPARSRSCSSRSPRWSGRRWSACPTSGSASACARASCCAAGATLDLDTTVVARLRAAGLATYKLPQRLEVLDALPTTASGKIQKHEIVRQLAGEADA